MTIPRVIFSETGNRMNVVGQFDVDSECRKGEADRSHPFTVPQCEWEGEADTSHPFTVPQCEWEGGESVWNVAEGEKRFPFCLLGLGTEMA